MPAILATLEAEIRRIVVQSQPAQIVTQDSVSKNNQSKMTWKCDSSSRTPALQVSAFCKCEALSSNSSHTHTHTHTTTKEKQEVGSRLATMTAWATVALVGTPPAKEGSHTSTVTQHARAGPQPWCPATEANPHSSTRRSQRSEDVHLSGVGRSSSGAHLHHSPSTRAARPLCGPRMEGLCRIAGLTCGR
jgi:hypothetical protein